MPHKRAGNRLSKERMAQVKQAWLEYTNPDLPPEERPTQLELGHKYGLPQTTISYWFGRFRAEQSGYSPEFPTTDMAADELTKDERPLPFKEWRRQRKTYSELLSTRQVAREAISHISDRARKSAEQAIIIGDIITNRYGDLIKIAVAQGIKIEDFITEVFNWYERKTQLEQYLKDLETKLADLQQLTEPNFVFRHKANILFNFARQCLTARLYGLKINPRKAVRALQIELDKIAQKGEIE